MDSAGEKLISFGAGVNSTAMIIFMFNRNEGLDYPIVFADTGSEMPDTYIFLKQFKQYLKKKWGKEIITVSPKTHNNLYSKRIRMNENINSIEDYCLQNGVVPFVRFRWCTDEFKRSPVTRWGKQNKIKKENSIIGFSYDEKRRVEKNPDFIYPLIEHGIDRDGCEKIIKNEGLMVPSKSACFFCPYKKEIEWYHLWKYKNDLFKRAVAIEDNATKSAGRKVSMRIDGVTVREIGEGFKQEKSLFSDIEDYSRYQCNYCGI